MLLVGNWKAYVDSAEKAKTLTAAAKRTSGRSDVTLVVAPPAPFIGLLAAGNRSSLSFAAQDISDSTGGAATGETIARAVREAGATYVILGHSERRARGETDALIAEKVQHALAQGLVPIVCVGERERDADATYLHVLRTQISAAFEPLSRTERLKIILAYEPVWAIGKSALEAITPAELTEMMLYIRKTLGTYVPGKEPGTILYGGSVEPENARALCADTGIDGFLVGRASTDAESFAALARALSTSTSRS